MCVCVCVIVCVWEGGEVRVSFIKLSAELQFSLLGRDAVLSLWEEIRDVLFL